MFVVQGAMTEPAPVPIIQTEFSINFGSRGDFIEARVIHGELLIGIFKEGFKSPIPDEQNTPMRGAPHIRLVPYPDWLF
jgi:hypothetical protein